MNLDPNFPSIAQQFSTESYAVTNELYDRGHLAATGHLNLDEESRKDANYMTNILPQMRQLNQGLWRETEVITEKYRMLGVSVYGGVRYNEHREREQDFFRESHGVMTPDYFWKVLVINDKYVFSWYFPNTGVLTENLEDYEVNIPGIERRLNDGLGTIVDEFKFTGGEISPRPKMGPAKDRMFLPADYSVLNLELRNVLREKHREEKLQNYQAFLEREQKRQRDNLDAFADSDAPSSTGDIIEQDKLEPLPELNDIFSGVLKGDNYFLTRYRKKSLLEHTLPKAKSENVKNPPS